jgi:hypothetical protein
VIRRDAVSPPPVEAFDAWPRAAGSRAARVEIADVAVEFEGLPDPLADRMAVAYAPYLTAPTGAGRPLRVRALQAPIEYFVPPGFARGWEVYRMHTALDGGVFRTVSYRLASWIDVKHRQGAIALASGDLDPAPRALENFLRSAVAWLAIDIGGFFLHGASIVRGGRCYLFYGPSGAGKSTLSAMNSEGEVISDDLTLVLGRPGGIVAAGGPFRGTYTRGTPLVGTFPVAGFYRLRKDARTFLAPDDGGCFADLLGNLPFVVDQLPSHSHLIDRVRSRVDGARLRYLHFRKDENFWPAVDSDIRGVP